MPDVFEEIRQQIHEIRNLAGPIHLKMTDLEMRVEEMRRSADERCLTVESKVLGAFFRLDQQDIRIADILGRLGRLEAK